MKSRWCWGIALTILALLVVPRVAGAAGKTEPISFYVAVRGGPGWADNSTRNPGPQGAEMKFKSEYDVNLAAGSRLLPWLRTEAELGFANMSLDELHPHQRGGTIDAHGHDRQYRGMISVYLDGVNSTVFTPFVGAGMGATRANLDISWELPRSGERVRADDWDWAFAWQAVAGVAWRITPCLELELAYRYYATNDRSHANHKTASQPDVVVDGTRASFVHAGLRYNF